MTYDYDFETPTTTPSCADTIPAPSQQVLRNILDFARSYEAVEVEGVRFDLFLN